VSSHPGFFFLRWLGTPFLPAQTAHHSDVTSRASPRGSCASFQFFPRTFCSCASPPLMPPRTSSLPRNVPSFASASRTLATSSPSSDLSAIRAKKTLQASNQAKQSKAKQSKANSFLANCLPSSHSLTQIPPSLICLPNRRRKLRLRCLNGCLLTESTNQRISQSM